MSEPAVRRILGVRSGPAATVMFRFEGRAMTATAGESIAAALAGAGIRATRRTQRQDQPRGYYCGMGICWECVVMIAGVGQRRACVTPAADGLDVRRVAAGDPA